MVGVNQEGAEQKLVTLTEPWPKRPKIVGRLASPKRGLVKMKIFDSIFHPIASMFGSQHAPISSGAPIPTKGWRSLQHQILIQRKMTSSFILILVINVICSSTIRLCFSSVSPRFPAVLCAYVFILDE